MAQILWYYHPMNQVVIRIVQLRIDLIQVPPERLAAQALTKAYPVRNISIVTLQTISNLALITISQLG